MEHLHWELSVLAKAVEFQSLSGASSQIRLSQPQLSRIVKRIEAELGVVLLDRSSKRKSGWTPMARELSALVLRSNRSLFEGLEALKISSKPKRLSIATLEGLAPLASRLSRLLLEKSGLHTVELDVLDLGFLEEAFLRGEYDLILSSRTPQNRKLRRCRSLGYQALESKNPMAPLRVLTPFEFNQAARGRTHRSPAPQADNKKLISNTLLVRREWIEKFKAGGTLPSALLKQKPSRRDGHLIQDVLLLGNDSLHSELWAFAEKMTLE